MNSHDMLLTFPCQFPIKIIGKASDAFEIKALSILRQYVPELKENALKVQTSKQGHYISMTVTILAQNQEQLDNIYRELSSDPDVLMAL